MNAGAERPILVEPFKPTAVVALGKMVDKDGNQLTVANQVSYGLSQDEFSTADVATVTTGQRKSLPVITIGTGRVKLAATLAKGDKCSNDANGDAVLGTVGQFWNVTLREGGAAGDLVEAFIQTPGTKIP